MWDKEKITIFKIVIFFRISHTGGSKKLNAFTDKFSKLSRAFEELYFETTNPNYPIRKLSIGFGNIINKDLQQTQLNLFSVIKDDDKEEKLQRTVNKIKNKYGKNSILRGMSYQKEATAKDRNKLVGGHNAE